MALEEYLPSSLRKQPLHCSRKTVLQIVRLDRLVRNVGAIAMKGDVEFVALGKPQANRVTVWWRCVLARPSARSYLL
jgi:hypothetical protein